MAPDRSPPLGAAPVTVAIATYNRAALLHRALESCRQQSVPPERVIVVDDGSTADTAQVVAAFEGLAIDYVNVGKVGLGRARNLATERCTTPWLCIHDDDDVMLPNRIADHVAGLSAGANMSHGGWINFSELGELDYHAGKPVDEDVILYAGNAVTHGACCYETAILRQFPYRTDVVGGADFDMVVRAVRSGIRCAHTGSYVLLRRRHADSMSATVPDGQAATRRAVVAAIDAGRSPEDIVNRITAARLVAELAINPPSFRYFHRAVGLVGEPMRVVVRVPRSAEALFGFLAAFQRADQPFELFLLDPEPGLASPLVLASAPETNLDRLDELDAALRQIGLKVSLLAATASLFDTPRAEFEPKTETGCFRVVLRSDSLRELQLAYCLLRNQRRWEWYIVIRPSCDGRGGPVFTMVSAPFSTKNHGRNTDLPTEVCYFVMTQTNITPDVILGT